MWLRTENNEELLCYRIRNVRFDVTDSGVLSKLHAFWNVTPCLLVNSRHRVTFKRT